MDVCVDDPFTGGAARPLVGLRHTRLAQQVDGLAQIPGGFGQRLLAFHHARAGLIAELLDLLSGNGHLKVLTRKRRPSGALAVRVPPASESWVSFLPRGPPGCRERLDCTMIRPRRDSLA